MAYEVVMPYHLHMPSYFLETFTEYPYGQIAYLAGEPQYARMVGWAMFHAPKEWCLPCHRVVNSQGRLVPGWQEQKALLEKEGVTLKANGCVNMKLHQWQPADHE